VLAECNGQGFLFGAQHRRVRAFGSIAASWTKARFL
jgi:hypothetical protein